MKNLYNQKDCEAIIKRLDSIHPYSENLWGKMDVNQMVVHIKDQLDIAVGYKTAMAQGPLILKMNIGKWLALYVVPWGKGKLKTPREMDALNNGTILSDFDSDKHLLVIRINEFISKSELEPHPFFGKISKRDWGRLAWKHLNHHLEQFGA